MRLALSFALMTACTNPVDRQPLAALRATRVFINQIDQTSTSIALETPDCASLDVDAVVTFAGARLPIPDAVDASGCTLNEFSLERPAAPTATLTIADPSDTWTIAFPRPHDGDLALEDPPVAGATTTIVWRNGPQIFEGYVNLDRVDGDRVFGESMGDPGIRFPASPGNTVDIDVPADAVPRVIATIWMVGEIDLGSAIARGTETARCDGPASCHIEQGIYAVDVMSVGSAVSTP